MEIRACVKPDKCPLWFGPCLLLLNFNAILPFRRKYCMCLRVCHFSVVQRGKRMRLPVAEDLRELINARLASTQVTDMFLCFGTICSKQACKTTTAGNAAWKAFPNFGFHHHYRFTPPVPLCRSVCLCACVSVSVCVCERERNRNWSYNTHHWKSCWGRWRPPNSN